MRPSVTLSWKLELCSSVLNASVVRQVQSKRTRLRQNLPSIIQEANDLRFKGIISGKVLLPGLIDGWKAAKEKQALINKTCGHLFNPLTCMPIGETTHSRLLGELLDPIGSHGQGRDLLHAFLDSIDVYEPSAGEWALSIEEGKVDLCLWRSHPASVIIIENKSNGAVDQPHQLYRYWYENIHKPYPMLDYSSDIVKRAFQIIYLPPTAGKVPEAHSIQRPTYLASLGLPVSLGDVGVTVKICSFRDHIVAWLIRCEELVPTRNYRLKAYLQFYKELWI